MSTIQDVTPEQLARLIYQYREALAHDIGQEANHNFSWDHASQDDRMLMVAAARLTLLELSTAPPETRRNSKYFAVPVKPSGAADPGPLNESTPRIGSL